MYPLRLRSHLVLHWRGQRYIRGRIYEAATQAEYLDMTGTGAFVPAEAAAPRSPREIAAALAERLEVVAVRDAGLGDTLMALPFVQEFGRINARIDVSYAVASPYVELIAAQPGLHRVYDLAAGRGFQRDIDLCEYVERARGSLTVPRSRLFGRAFGIDRRVPPLPLALGASWAVQARERLQAAGWTPGQPLASLTASGTCSRRSYAEPLVREVARLLAAAGVWVALTDSDQVSSPTAGCETREAIGRTHADRSDHGNPAYGKDTEFPELRDRILSFRGSLSVAELAGLLSLAHVVIGPDTGVLHIGGHLGKPLVGLFTDWPARLRLDPYNAFAFEPRELPCAPCFNRGCPPEMCTRSADPREVAAAALACFAPRWRLGLPGVGGDWRRRVAVLGRPETPA